MCVNHQFICYSYICTGGINIFFIDLYVSSIYNDTTPLFSIFNPNIFIVVCILCIHSANIYSVSIMFPSNVIEILCYSLNYIIELHTKNTFSFCWKYLERLNLKTGAKKHIRSCITVCGSELTLSISPAIASRCWAGCSCSMFDWGCRISSVKVVHSQGWQVGVVLVEGFFPLYMGFFIGLLEWSGVVTSFSQGKQSKRMKWKAAVSAFMT